VYLFVLVVLVVEWSQPAVNKPFFPEQIESWIFNAATEKKKKEVLKIPSSNGHNQGSERSGSDGNIKVCTRAVIE